jgi:uncharacterized protein (TIGR03000 family)
MFRKMVSFGGALLLVGALVFATPGPSAAASPGGRAGGAHVGGAHVGGVHVGGFHGDFRGGVRGFGVGPRFGFRGYGYGGLGYPYGGLGDYGYYPYSDTYGYPYSDTYVVPDTTLYGSSEASEPSADAPPAAIPDQRAHVTVTVPPNAQVWFNGTLTTSTGSDRHFDSPPLTSGRQYTYDVRATWNQDGQPVTQEQKVTVTAGAYVSAVFPKPGS